MGGRNTKERVAGGFANPMNPLGLPFFGPFGPLGPLGPFGPGALGPLGPLGPLQGLGPLGPGPLGPLGPLGGLGPFGPGPLGPLGPLGLGPFHGLPVNNLLPFAPFGGCGPCAPACAPCAAPACAPCAAPACAPCSVPALPALPASYSSYASLPLNTPLFDASLAAAPLASSYPFASSLPLTSDFASYPYSFNSVSPFGGIAPLAMPYDNLALPAFSPFSTLPYNLGSALPPAATLPANTLPPATSAAPQLPALTGNFSPSTLPPNFNVLPPNFVSSSPFFNYGGLPITGFNGLSPYACTAPFPSSQIPFRGSITPLAFPGLAGCATGNCPTTITGCANGVCAL